MLGKIYTSTLQPNQLLIDIRNIVDSENTPIPDAIRLPLFTKQQEQYINKCGTSDSKSSQWMQEAAKKIEVFLREHPDLKSTIILCKDGRWISRFAWDIARLQTIAFVFENGIKGLKKWIRKTLAEAHPYFVLIGTTGSGKTEILRICKEDFGMACIDFELLAKHNGSVFGNIEEQKQPTQFAFEFMLAKILSEIEPGESLLVEYEPGNLGALHIPIPMLQQIEMGTKIILQRSMDRRIDTIVQQYAGKNDALIRNGIHRISSRLGDTLTEDLCNKLNARQYAEIAAALLRYYDEREQYQISGNPLLQVNTDNLLEGAQTIVQFMQKKTPPAR